MGRLSLFLLLTAGAANAASAAASAPARVASIGYLCTDELALLLAWPGQLVSVTRFAHERAETPLAARARGLHRNAGTMTSVLAQRPDLVITGGLGAGNAAALAQRLGIGVVDLPPPASIADMRANIRRLAAALGTAPRGEALIQWMNTKLGSVPTGARPALMLTAGGLSPQPGTISEALLARAGIAHERQASPAVTRERLLTRGAAPLVVGRYRSEQFSLAQERQDLAIRAARGRVLRVDGRHWTCPGPLAAHDVARLREALLK